MGKRTSFPEGKGTSTPWGAAQYSEVLTRGVVAYTTAGHGGVSVTINWARKNLSPWAGHLDGGLYCRANRMLESLVQVARNGRTIWSRPQE